MAIGATQVFCLLRNSQKPKEEPITSNKLLSRLLRMVGFKVTWFEMLEEDGLLHLGVKPHKTGCRCPHCGRRSTIVSRADLRTWDDVVVCGMRSIFWRFTVSSGLKIDILASYPALQDEKGLLSESELCS